MNERAPVALAVAVAALAAMVLVLVVVPGGATWPLERVAPPRPPDAAPPAAAEPVPDAPAVPEPFADVARPPAVAATEEDLGAAPAAPGAAAPAPALLAVDAADPASAPLSAWTLDRDGIRGAVQEVLPRVRGCYDDALQVVPDLAGTMTVSFVVRDVGGVGQVAEVGLIDDRLDDGPVEACVFAAMRALQFDAPTEGEMSVTYPMVFSAP